MSEYKNLLRENQMLRSMVDLNTVSSEQEIEDSFIKLAQALQTEDMDGEIGEVTRPENEKGPKEVGDELGGLTDEDIDIEEALDSPDDTPANPLPGNFNSSYTLQIDSDHKEMLENPPQNMDPKEAEEKSMYIEYINPETRETMAVQGFIYGKDASDGEGMPFVGGVSNKEKLDEDMDVLKEAFGGDEGNITEEFQHVLVPVTQISDAATAFKKLQQEDKDDTMEKGLEKSKKEKEEKEAEAEEEDVSESMDLGEEPEESESKATPAVPNPIGKVPASFHDKSMRRWARLQQLKNIK